MDLKDYKYRSTFTSTAKIIVAPTHDKFLSKASLAPLRGLVPDNIDLDSPDLLYFAANGGVGGLKNANDDSVSAETAIAINRSAINKFIDLGHNRTDLCGCVLYTGFSRFGTNEPLTEEEASKLTEPFNMAVVGVIWKLAAPLIAKYIVKSDGGMDEECLSLSWEVLFSHFDIAVAEDSNLFGAKIVKESDADFSAYSKLLRSEGGTGKDPSGNNVFRVIRGGDDGDPIIAGYGIVERPAAAVKGILPLEKPEIAAEQPADSDASAITLEIVNRLNAADESLRISPRDVAAALSRVGDSAETAVHSIETLLAAASEQAASEKNINLTESRVTSITPPYMKIESLEQLNSQWAEIRKLESAAAVADFIQAIEEGAKKHMENFTAAETRAKQLEEAQAAIQKQATELKASLDQVQTELAQVRANAAAAEMQAKFTERMASFDEKYDLDDEDRKLIAEDVIACQSDEAFEAYAKKCAKLLGGKAKKKPAPPAKPEDKGSDDNDEDDKGGDMKAAIASVVETPGQTTVPGGVEPIVDDSLKAKMAAAFGPALQINGKAANTAPAPAK